GGRETHTGADLHATVGAVPEIRCAQAWSARDRVDGRDGRARRSPDHGWVSATSRRRHDGHLYPSRAHGRTPLAGPRHRLAPAAPRGGWRAAEGGADHPWWLPSVL